ncbi:aromatic ring-hydroxylating oxygenase subunit alpha [Herbaspirillum camelliae]|uniref:aromatic ring-hydroxylating oxygenase subunit alpha n=1 Tax=Herbaspirillum camelliae TaxID=1892903 RepID=UPI00094A026B|nr:aromatic ring-hydroxylating dioxygenase subunit alpha [Herbaspirillum camelliae]
MQLSINDTNVVNDWLTVGPAKRLLGRNKEHPYTTRLLEEEVKIWRDDDEQLHGTLGGEFVHVQEQYDYLWVCAGIEPNRFFAFPEFSEKGRRIVDCDGVGVSVSGLRMIENFLDMGHFPFVHASYLGEVPNTEVAPYTVEIDEENGEIWARECRFLQPKTSMSAKAPLEVQYQYRVMQPFSAILYKTAFTRPGEMDALALLVQPISETEIIAYCLLAYFDDESSDNDLISFQHTIFAQDKPILENQVPKRLPLHTGVEIPTRCDAASVAYRRWLKSRDMRYGAIANA